MKIIRPIDLTGAGIVESNAPGEVYPVWEPIGVDLAQSFGQVLVTAAGDKVYALDYPAGPASNLIKVYDTVTQETEVIDFSGLNTYPSCIQVSPDGQYMAVITYYNLGLSFESGVFIYSLASGQLLYSKTDTRNPGSRDGRRYGVRWSQDSSKFAFWAFKEDLGNVSNGGIRRHLYIVSTASWTAVESQETPFDFRDDLSLQPAADDYFEDVEFNENGSTLFAFGGSLQTYIGNYYVMMAVSTSTGATTAHLASDGLPREMAYNPYRSELIAVTGSNCRVYSPSLIVQSNKPDFSGLSRYSTDPILTIDVGRLYVRDRVSQEGYTTFSLTDYANAGPLTPGVTMDLHTESNDYYVTSEAAGGFGLYKKTTFDKVVAANPSVVAGNIYTYNNHNYEALTDNNDRPDVGAIADPPTWLDLGFINPLRMFDNKLDSRTVAPGTLTITASPGAVTNGLALFNVSAQSVQVTVDDPVDGLVYDSGDIAMLDNSAVSNWWDYFYSPYVAKADVALTDLPPYPDAEITITISNPGNDAAIGEMVLGRIQNIGDIQYGTSVGIIDSSTKERDAFGNFEIIERKFSKRAEFDVHMPTGSVSGIQRILAGYRASPVVWIGDIDYEATIVYGFYRDFQLNFAHHSLSDATITVEGL